MPTTQNTRLYVRTDATHKARIEHAAELAHLSVSDFVRIAVEERAETVIADELTSYLSPSAFDALYEALDAPLEPNEALRRAARKDRSFVQK